MENLMEPVSFVVQLRKPNQHPRTFLSGGADPSTRVHPYFFASVDDALDAITRRQKIVGASTGAWSIRKARPLPTPAYAFEDIT